ncbi:gastrin-releasing peptide isoform X2 [Cottoperca gobio]|nr:gastrin-releasing peptide isoform X2 [Cottoperca gobio]
MPCMLLCSDSPAVVVGKMYPRGNHWAVGHLMGKKSIEHLPDRDYLTPSETAGVTERLLEALMQHKNQKQTMPQTADMLLRLHGDRDKYLREMSDLLLLVLRLRDNDST